MEASLLYFDLSENFKPDRTLQTLEFQGRLVLEDQERTAIRVTGLAIAQLAACDTPGIAAVLNCLSPHPALLTTLQSIAESLSLPSSYFLHFQALGQSLSLSATEEDATFLGLSSFLQVHILLLEHGKEGTEALLALDKGCAPVVCLERFGDSYSVLVGESWTRMTEKELKARLRTIPTRELQAKVNPFPLASDDPKSRLIQVNSELITDLLPFLCPGLLVPPSTAALLIEASELATELGVDGSAYAALAKVIAAKK